MCLSLKKRRIRMDVAPLTHSLLHRPLLRILHLFFVSPFLYHQIHKVALQGEGGQGRKGQMSLSFLPWLSCLCTLALILTSHCAQSSQLSRKDQAKSAFHAASLYQAVTDNASGGGGHDSPSQTQTLKSSFSGTKSRVSNPESTCLGANDWMKREYADWRAQADDFDAHTLPKCLRQWAGAILPAGTREYPVLECHSPDGWENACSTAGGMQITVTATANFPGNSTRSMTFLSCVSNAKPCIASRTSADFVWIGLVKQIQTWCSNQTMYAFRCDNVKISTNFWTVANMPKVIKIVVGVIVAIAVIIAAIILVVYCRWRRKKEHEEAMERTMLLRLARRVSARPSALSTMDDDASLSTMGYDASSRSSSLNSSSSSSSLLSPQFTSIQANRISAASLPPLNP